MLHKILYLQGIYKKIYQLINYEIYYARKMVHGTVLTSQNLKKKKNSETC
jgi:hypothetical protein